MGNPMEAAKLDPKCVNYGVLITAVNYGLTDVLVISIIAVLV